MADNVIKAVFASGRRVKTAPLWRYDHGIRLQIVGLELPDNYEMHFSNSKTGEAKTVLADASGAVIPAEYLIPGTEVYAWVYLVGDSYGRTKAEIIIPVDPKAQPTDQEPTPEQQPVIEQAINELNDAQDALEEATSQIAESGITPEERTKLAGIEAGAEVNVIEEVRAFDLLRGYVPLPVTNKGVNLPKYREPDNLNDVVYADFEIDADSNVTLSPFVEPIIDAVNVHGQTVIARVKISNESYPDLLPLIHLDGYNVRFAGFTAAEEKLDIWYDLIQHRWRAQFKELVDWDSADNSYVWANQGSENSGKVLTVGADGNVAPQDTGGVPAGGTLGQVLVKASDSDYDGAWADPSEFTDEIEVELAALDPDIHSEAYNWTLGRNYNSSGSLGAQAGFAITGYFDAKPGTLFVNRSVPVDGAGKNTQVFIHQFSGSTWLRRKGLMNEPHYAAVDDDADRVRIAFGYPSDQGVTITQQMVDENFAIRIVKKVPEEASDVGAVAANQGSANAGKVLTVGSDGAVTPQEAAGGVVEDIGITGSGANEALYISTDDYDYSAPTSSGLTAALNTKLNTAQGTAHAGEFLVVGSDGNVTTKTMSAWQGGNY